MKRKHQNRQPGIGDFKNQCSEMVKKHDARIIRTIYETIHETVYWKGSIPSSIKKDVLLEISIIFKKEKICILYLEEIVIEILEYFGKFLILLNSDKVREI